MPNFKLHGRHWWPCGWIFKFCKFWRKKKEIEPFDVISENSSPKGFFWPNKKKTVISLLSADSRCFRTDALKIHCQLSCVLRIAVWYFICERELLPIWLFHHNLVVVLVKFFFMSERKRKKTSCPYSSSKKPKRLPLLAFEIITALNFSNLLREHSVPSLLGIFHFKKYFNKFLSSSILYLQILWEVLFWTSICRTYFGHCDETKVK